MAASDNAMVLPGIQSVIIESKDLTGSMDNFTKALLDIKASYSKRGVREGVYDVILSLVKKPRYWQRLQPDFEKDLEKIIKVHVKSFSHIVWE